MESVMLFSTFQNLMDSTVSHVLLNSIVLKVAIHFMKLESIIANLKKKQSVNKYHMLNISIETSNKTPRLSTKIFRFSKIFCL